jgi:Ca2+-binding RTX toxin-like protein
MRRLTAAGACVLGLLGAAGPAQAATVQVDAFSSTLRYIAVAGEANNVTISLAGGTFTVSEAGPGVTLAAGAGCAGAGTTVTCPDTGVRNIQVFAGDMADTVTVNASLPADLRGGTGADTLTGGPGDDRIEGEDGDDVLTGRDGSDQLGGSFDDGNDTMNGGPGSDFCYSGPGNDVCNGDAGNDGLGAGDAADGADAFNGGTGQFDGVEYSSRKFSVSVTLNGVADDGAAAEGDNIAADVENVSTGDGDDAITGNDATNQLSSGDGNDTLIAGGGNDNVFAGSGNDNLDGGPGNDVIGGDQGNDTVAGGPGDDEFFEDTTTGSADVVSGGEGDDQLTYDGNAKLNVSLDGQPNDGQSGEADNVQPDIENVTTGPDDDVLSGGDGPNQLEGGGGDDVISGGGGGDSLSGGDGNDALDGGAGRDLIDGGGGRDLVRSRDGSPDQVRCGTFDDVVLADLLDAVGADCETPTTGAIVAAAAVAVDKRGVARIKLTCPAAEAAACGGTVALRDSAGKALGSARYNVAAGATATVRVKLSRAARKRLRRTGQRVAGQAVLSGQDAAGGPTGSAAPVVLKRR